MRKNKIKKAGIIVIIMTVLIMAVTVLLPFYEPIYIKGNLIPYDYMIHDYSVDLSGYKGTSENVKVPSYIWGRPVQYFLGDWNSDCLKNLVVPDTVKAICGKFEGCKNLETVSFGSNVELIRYNVFKNCTRLKEIVFPPKLQEIRYGCCQGCTSLEKVVIPQGVYEIEAYAFYDCVNLKEVVIPDSVTWAAGTSFLNTPWLDSQTDEFVTIGDGVLIAYRGKETKVVVPDGVKYIGGEVFGDGIEEITLPESVIAFDEYAFKNCSDLKNVIIKGNATREKNESKGIISKLSWIYFTVPEDSALISRFEEWDIQYDILRE